MIVKRTPSAPPIDLVLSMLYVAPYRLPGDDVSGSSVSRPSKPGQVGHVFVLQPSRRPCGLIAMLNLPRTRTKTDRSATIWLAVGNSLSQISCQRQFRGACLRDTSLVLSALERRSSRTSTSNWSPG